MESVVKKMDVNYPQETYMTYMFKFLEFWPTDLTDLTDLHWFLGFRKVKKKSAIISGISGKKNGCELSARNLYDLYV